MATLSIQLDDPTPDAKGPGRSASLINAIIPDLIKRRAGRLPSLRSTLTSGILERSQQAPSPPPSPPPPYVDSDDLEVATLNDAQEISNRLDGLLGNRGASDTVYHAAGGVSASEVRWKHVIEGCRLIECARREAAADDEDPELTRKMYIDGLGYLLKGLPELSPSETVQLANYLPASLIPVEPLQMEQDLQSSDDNEQDDANNYLYRFVTMATMYVVLLASFLIPILERWATTIYSYDQRYRISHRVANTTSRTASSLARAVFASLNEGKAGEVALGLTLYTVASASRGFLDGYERAVKRQSAVEHSDEGISVV